MSWIENEPNIDLRKHYSVIFEASLVLALLLMLMAFKIDFRTEQSEPMLVEPNEIVRTIDVVQTEHPDKPPVPPRPQVPVEVPNSEIIDEEDINLDAEWDLGEKLTIPDESPAPDESPTTPFIIVEKMPQLIGGAAKLHKQIQYPDLARKAGIEGRVIIQFVVDKQGHVTQAKVLRGIGGGCDKEALRILKEAQFSPGIQRGVPVQVKMTLPIIFKLQN